MILNINGKNIVFGMRWKILISGGTANKDARAAKSTFMWHADKSIYFGLLAEKESKEHLKQPLHSGAIALAHMHAAHPNILLVLPIPEGAGYIVCGIRQGRPKSGFDLIVDDELEVNRLVNEFSGICEQDSFLLLGDAHIDGIIPLSFEDLAEGCESYSQLKKVSGIPFNPLVLLTLMVVIAGAWGGGKAYMKHRKAEEQRKALAAQKTSQQLYSESLQTKRNDPALLASNLPVLAAWIGKLPMSGGGWKLSRAICQPLGTKVNCSMTYLKGKNPEATNQTFLESIGRNFESVDFIQNMQTIKATATANGVSFNQVSLGIDSAKTHRDEAIEFGSILQSLSKFGDQVFKDPEPYGIPPGVNIAELGQSLISTSQWEFNGTVRSLALLTNFPKYSMVNQIDFSFKDAPEYEVTKSMAVVKVTGAAFSKK